MKGKIFGIGVGPGDSELITIKALKVIEECDVIAMPGKNPQESMAYKIAKKAYPEITQKESLPIVTPMTKDRKMLQQNYTEIANRLESILEEGKKIGFLTIGDPTIYSTYMYIHQKIVADGYEAQIINGVPSFCAVAGRLGISLAERNEQMHFIPSSYAIRDALELSGTKVFMKAGSKIGSLKEALLERQCDAVMVENCGMEEEKVFLTTEEIPAQSGYYSILIVKDK